MTVSPLFKVAIIFHHGQLFRSVILTLYVPVYGILLDTHLKETFSR